MKMKFIASMATALALSVATTAAAFAETVTLRYSNWLPQTLFLYKDVFVPWMAEVEQVTDGRVKFEVLPKVVGTAASQFDVVRDGLADISYINASYTPGRFVSTEIGELPLGGDNSSVMSPAFDRTYRKHLAGFNEFAGIEVLSVFTISPIQTFTAKRPIKSAEDFRGLKLRSPNNTTTDALTLMGAVPIHKTASEAYEMLATGAIDGQTTIPNSIPGFNQLELLKYVMVIPGGLANSIGLMGVNKDKWAEISEEDQKAILAVSTEKLAEAVGTGYTKADEEAFGIMREAGYEIDTANPEMVTKFAELLKPVEVNWIARAKEKGIPDPEGLLAAFRAEIVAGSKGQ
ncbi:TRAP transporter substrate-binding protein [Mesorhizobium sp. CGMCC 1.15528]|uniref:TRAP transporter substrate-binding protein n=1 Tax=Mesorhizobium zhangyense TaxID=1776730 RepID=A0A7C9VD97_9HYPH|nr:TRAP transporter substrate-binding protein [Mesorhizobium zhangyense]NGN44566.1 TRAP transporter substrate-binding protein [Mesorhizobium zhangyense]